MKRPTYSFVIPVYNEEEGIPHLISEIKKVTSKIKEEVEVIFVDDGSKDKSYELLYRQHKKEARFKVLKFSKNFGHQIAVTAGLDVARGKAVIIMDADLQDPPSVILDLISQWKMGFEVVHAVRKSRAGETKLKLLTADLFYRFLSKITETPIVRNAGDFRLLDRKAVDALKQIREQHRFVRGLSCWVGFKQSCVFYERNARVCGETKYPLKKMMSLAINAITSFSNWPLKMTFMTGVSLSFLSLFITVLLIIAKFWGFNFIQGWTSILVAIVFFNGLTMIMLGLIGFYIGRIFEEVKRRPLYIIDTFNGEDHSKK